MRRTTLLIILATLLFPAAAGQMNGDMGGGHNMDMDMAADGGMVMNENTDELPPGCTSINGWENITVHAGKMHAKRFPGKMFTFDQHTWEFEPCTKVSVTFVNNDSVRHQFMVHGLPMEIYDMGMFTVEVTGPGSETGTFILPNERETYMVHCGVPQHEEKGMKAQIKVDGGDGDLAGIPGVTGVYNKYDYPRRQPWTAGFLILFTVALLSVTGILGYKHWKYTQREDG